MDVSGVQTWFQTGEDWWNPMTIAIEIFIPQMTSSCEFDTIAGEVRASGSASAIEAGWMGLGCYSTASWPWTSLNGNGQKNDRAIFHGDELPEGIESMASSGALTRGVCSA